MIRWQQPASAGCAVLQTLVQAMRSYVRLEGLASAMMAALSAECFGLWCSGHCPGRGTRVPVRVPALPHTCTRGRKQTATQLLRARVCGWVGVCVVRALLRGCCATGGDVQSSKLLARVAAPRLGNAWLMAGSGAGCVRGVAQTSRALQQRMGVVRQSRGLVGRTTTSISLKSFSKNRLKIALEPRNRQGMGFLNLERMRLNASAAAPHPHQSNVGHGSGLTGPPLVIPDTQAAVACC